MKTLLVAEHHGSQLAPSTLATARAAMELTDTYDVLVLGQGGRVVAEQAATLTNCRQVWLADDVSLQHQLPENSAKLIAQMAVDYDAVLMPASTFGKDMLPRVAALLDVPMLSDVVAIQSQDTFVCPMYAGNVLVTVQVQARKKVMTIRAASFDGCAMDQKPVDISPCPHEVAAPASHFISHEPGQSERPDLTSARVVVSGGRGLQDAAQFQLIEQLADALGAAVGATRALVDAGVVPNDYQVGQTGKVVAPELYLAVGISGAVQHLAGMKDSRVIVAINQDPDAPIFKVADYALVADLFEAVPQLISALSQES